MERHYFQPMISRLKHILIFIPGILIAACGDPEPKTISAAPPQTTKKVPVHSKKMLPTRIITTGIFHHDEVWENAANMKWTGLFKGKNGYYLKNTPIRMFPVHDPVLDEAESVKTGWEISTPGKDTTLILLSRGKYFSNRKITAAILPKDLIYPGDTVSFRYAGIDYHLFATGRKEQQSEEIDWYTVSEYKLYLTAKIKGTVYKSLLSDHPFFDDQMVTVLFIGDLDDDGIADVILDDSYHYNMTKPTIYFSRPAAKGQVVKRVASHESVGC